MSDFVIDDAYHFFERSLVVCKNKGVIVFDFISFVDGFGKTGKRAVLIEIIAVADEYCAVFLLICGFIQSKGDSCVLVFFGQRSENDHLALFADF